MILDDINYEVIKRKTPITDHVSVVNNETPSKKKISLLIIQLLIRGNWYPYRH